MPNQALRQFSETHIEEDCRHLSGVHDNGLFFGCSFDKLNNLVLKNCDLNRSRFETSHIIDTLGFTMTLGCHSFKNVEFSELLFDLFLLLVSMTKGNDEKRAKLLDVVGRERAEALLRVLHRVE